MHFVCACIRHIREDSKLGEQSRLQVSVDLILHGTVMTFGRNSIDDIREPTAVLVIEMNDVVLHLWNDVQVELWVGNLGP